MALRLLSYLMLFYLEFIKNEQIRKSEHLPAVFPVLLYSGEEKWTAAQSIEELIEIPLRLPSVFIPSFRYYKIAENEWSSESLIEMDNIVSRLFLIETSDAENIGEVTGEAIDDSRREVDSELRRSFGLWLGRLLEKRHIDIDIDIDTMTGQEVRTMLEANLRRYEEELLEKDRQEADLIHAREMKALNVDREIIKKVIGIDIDSIE